MIRLLRWLLTGDGHSHRWEVIRRGPCTVGNKVYGYYYDCRCSICGKIKDFRT